MPLTRKIIAAEPTPRPGKVRKLFDGEGLFLMLQNKGSPGWRLKFRHNGKESMISLGTYPEVAIETARERANTARAALKEGRSPTAERRVQRESELDAACQTFGKLGKEYLGLDDTKAKRTADKHLWLYGLLKPLHDRPINEITTPDVLKILRAIEATGKREAAHRAGQFAGRVFRYAIQTGPCTIANPAADLRGALKPVKTVSHAAITDPGEFGWLMQFIDSDEYSFITVRNGLRLLARTFVRPGELRGALWSEFFDLDGPKPEWRIPAERMKMKRPHLVPLSRQAVAILKSQRQVLEDMDGHMINVFPGGRGTSRRPMSDAAMNMALKTLFYDSDSHTPHGFRSTASTLLNELGFDSALIELQLAHAKRDKVAGIYDRSQRVSERREMMQRWSDYIDELKAKKRT